MVTQVQGVLKVNPISKTCPHLFLHNNHLDIVDPLYLMGVPPNLQVDTGLPDQVLEVFRIVTKDPLKETFLSLEVLSKVPLHLLMHLVVLVVQVQVVLLLLGLF